MAHRGLRLPGVKQFTALIELTGETGLNKEEAGQAGLKPIGGLQPSLGLGWGFPIANGVRAEVRWDIVTSRIFEFGRFSRPDHIGACSACCRRLPAEWRKNYLTRMRSPHIVFRHRKPLFTMQTVEREILLSFWKVHILHHANEGAIHGQLIIHELRRHGYEISPGTLYPLLGRLRQRGWLDCTSDQQGGKRARKDYRLTPKGKKVLKLIRAQVKELYDEVVTGNGHKIPESIKVVQPRKTSSGGSSD